MNPLQVEEGMYLGKIRQWVSTFQPRVYAGKQPVADIAWRTTSRRETAAEAARAVYRPCRLPFVWGRRRDTTWFRLRLDIPRAWCGRRVVLRLNPEGEAAVFHRGVPVQGLDANHDEVLLAARAAGGERVELFLEAIAASDFERHAPRTFRFAEVAAVNEFLRDAWLDFEVLYELARALPEGNPRRGRIVAAMNDAVNGCPFDGTPAELSAWAARARRALAPALAARNGSDAVTLAVHGHSHIDVAWKWTLAETVRKCSRTFSTVVGLLDRHPGFIFTQSQPQLYEFTRRHYPALYRKIVRFVKSGRWEAAGGLWVECDCNLSGGESLVRQMLHGKRFLREELGVDTPVAWLPDVFGYPGSLPQIFAKGGMPYFFTIKIDWNEMNLFPYASFWWKGIDGTRVLAHFGASKASYNGEFTIGELQKAGAFLASRDPGVREGLYPFGFGDGGGGPTEAMVEYAGRARDLAGIPRTRMSRVDDFFRRLAREGGRLPEWVGELYFELHRGTYTTQANAKRNNRKAEIALRGAEFLAAIDFAAGGRYPAAGLDRAWKYVLLNQFHDVLPGSSIGEVYREAETQYADVFRTIGDIAARATARLAARMDTRGPGRAVLVENELSWSRGGVVEVPARAGDSVVLDETGAALPVQRADGRLIALARGVPAMGAVVWRVASGRPRAKAGGFPRAGKGILENERLRVRFDARGRVSGIFDKRAGRELLPAGARANVFQLFEDRPREWDAWDIDFSFGENRRDLVGPCPGRVVERGPVRAALRFERRFGKSRIVQDVRIVAGSSVVEFFTRVDWHESHRLLKVAFPMDVHTDRVSCEIQFGAVERATHRNTGWDRARFEIPAHRWADLSEPGYGASLLNDGKYGYDVRGNVLRLSLLRAPSRPDPRADRGHHEFTYALYPHAGAWREALTVREGLALNVPLRAAAVPGGRPGPLGTSAGFFSVGAPNVVLDTVKRAEASEKIVLRLYEAHGARADCRLETRLPVRSARETDFHETGGSAVPVARGADGVSMALRFRPFEIKTVVLELQK
ncbi:MAG: glycoside hydrolase family 38 C-terminal domain-containing protein [Planctomycetota bacterium]